MRGKGDKNITHTQSITHSGGKIYRRGKVGANEGGGIEQNVRCQQFEQEIERCIHTGKLRRRGRAGRIQTGKGKDIHAAVSDTGNKRGRRGNRGKYKKVKKRQKDRGTLSTGGEGRRP